jgi:putative protease
MPVGSRVVRTSHAALLARARASFAAVSDAGRARRTRLDVRAFGGVGAPLKLVFTADGESATVRSEKALSPARTRALDVAQLREHLGKLGETPFALGNVDASGLTAGLFIPVSELNHLRQAATERLMVARDWARESRLAERRLRIEDAMADVAVHAREPDASWVLAADVFRIEDALAAAENGATEVSFDPFLRHPSPPLSRVRSLAHELAERGVAFRLRTPTIVRPTERAALDKWLALDVPILSGHLGLVAELAGHGRDVVADYAVNCFNQHAAATYFALGARRIVLSVELTAPEMRDVTAPWSGVGFDALVYGRPEGMTIEHCILSAAFDREPTTCRDLCVRDHPLVELTDPSGYVFPVATDTACRNRLLHSRPIEGSEFLPALWAGGLRGYRLLFNVPGDPVAELVARYRTMLGRLAEGDAAPHAPVRELVGSAFTRGHFARAV